MLSEATGSLAELFFARPISIVLIALTVISAGWPVYQVFREKRNETDADPVRIGVVDKASKIKKPAGELKHRPSNFWIAGFGLIAAAVAWYGLIDVDLQSSILPKVASGLMVIICAGLLVKAFRLPTGSTRRRPEIKPFPKEKICITVGLSIVYVLLSTLAGFFTTTFIMIYGLAWFLAPSGLRRRQHLLLLLVSGAICTTFYLVFARIFNVPFPEGFLI